MSAPINSATDAAREYYNSQDADNFYATIWGGEDIHIGLYESDDDPIAEASRRTVEKLASVPPEINAKTRVIDLGAGYGGAARYLAQQYGCGVTALNLSETENERHRAINAERGLDDYITVVDGSFEKIDAEDASFDLVWSQDAILHAGDREAVVREVARVLAPGGRFVFTDPMQSDDCPEGVLDPILARINLSTLGSPGFYKKACADAGLRFRGFEDLTHQLVRHYSRVLEETEKREEELRSMVSPDYIDRMRKGLGHWIEGGEKGWLAWGVMHFEKPA